jgi:epsilon-lactone hydrolase
VGDSPITDAIDDPIVSRASLRELREWYVGDADSAAPLVSPLWADATGLPPTLIHVGERELLSPDAVRFGNRLRAAGVDARCEVWDGMVHVWHFYAGYAPEADAALTAIAAWLHGLRRAEQPGRSA